jgi:hypothetical protein
MVLSQGTEVIKAQGNRVPEPKSDDFVTMTPILRGRLATNIDNYADTAFVGSIGGEVLTVTDMKLGTLFVGSQLLGSGIAPGTVVTGFDGGQGGVGTYFISPSQTLPSQIIAAGIKTAQQKTKVTVQLDVHGPASSDNAQTIATLLRDDFAVQAFAASGFDVSPLYASEPRQMPFVNGEQQVEERWVIDAVLQCNPVVAMPQQFADEVDVTVTNVDATYPVV